MALAAGKVSRRIASTTPRAFRAPKVAPFVTKSTAYPVASTSAPDEAVVATKLELLKKVACLNRGALATENDKYEVSSFVEVLEEASHSGSINLSAVQGKWELLYSSVEQFRSSPFFWAFQEGLVQDRSIAADIFKFTDSLPGAHIGAVYQTLSFDTGMLISEVDVVVFPGVRGTVVSTSKVVAEEPNRLAVTVVNTRVANSNLLPFLDNITVPVQDIFEQIRGPGATQVVTEVTYMDDDLRVSRTKPDDQIFIYRRV